MPAPVVVNFRVGGLAQLQQAFRTVESAMVRLERSAMTSAQGGSQTRVRLMKQEAETKVKLGEASYRTSAKLADQEAKASAKAEREKLREVEKLERQKANIRTRSAELAFRLAEKEVAAEKRAQEQIQKSRERFSRGVGGIINSSVGGLAGRAMNLAGTALTLGGGFTIANAVQEQFAAQRTAAQIVNAVTTTGTPPKGANVGSIMQSAGAVSAITGMSKDEILKGTLAYTRSARGGNFEGAMANQEFFAKLSKTTGTSIEDIGAAAGTLQSQNADLGKDPKKLQQMLLNAYAQTKSGSVSLKDAAVQFGKMGSTRGFYQGDEAKNQQTLFGLGQIAASGGSSEEIGTYVKDLSIEGAKHQDELRALGVKFNKSGQMESPEQMIGAVFKGTGGDLGKIEELFGARGLPLFGELSKSFRGAGGGDKGVKAVMDQIHGVTESTMSMKDLDSQFKQVMNTPAERFGVAIEKAKEVLQEKLTPWLEKFADKLPELMPKIESAIDSFAKLADWFIENPFTGLGAIVLASVTKDLAAAAIGEGVKVALTKLVSASSGAIGGVGGPSLGAVGAVGAGAAIGVGAGLLIVDQYGQAKDAERRSDFSQNAQLENRARDSKQDKVKVLADMEARVTELRAKRDDKGIGDITMGALGILTGRGQEVKEAERTKYKAATDEIDALNASIKKLRAEIDKGGGGGAANPAAANRNVNMGAAPRGGAQ